MFCNSLGTCALVNSRLNYKVDTGISKSIMKTGVTSMNDFGVSDIPLNNVNISRLKLEDVNKLLCKHFGDAWINDHGNGLLAYYKNVINNSNNDGDEENVEPCEYLEEVGLSI